MGRRLEGDMGNGYSTMCVLETAVRGGGGVEERMMFGWTLLVIYHEKVIGKSSTEERYTESGFCKEK